MKIDTQEIMNGSRNGEIVWICHYHRPDMHKKPLRNIPPTKVIVRCNDELPKNKTVYYSKSHFSPLSKTGSPLAKVISPVDNTGFRSRSGTPLFVFDNEGDCHASWNTQMLTYVGKIEKIIASCADEWKEEKRKLINMMD
jgi:hypothetical protein